MLITPVVVILLYFTSPVTCTLAALAFIFAAFTDWYDGYVARHENMVTNMGKFLDPLADKILISSVLIMFVHLQWCAAWVVIIIVCRELIITGLRAIAIDEGIVLAADNFGKAKTVMQIFAIIPMCLHFEIFGVAFWKAGEVLLYCAMLLAVFSCFNYCRYFAKQMKEREG